MSTSPDGLRPWSDDAVRRYITADRLRSYLQACDGSLSRAIELYQWNAVASASVLATTSMAEVVVRNALDFELTRFARERHGASSWSDVVQLDSQGRADVVKARERATQYGRKPEVHGKVIAELSLGFWRYLVEGRYYTSLWVPATHRAFAHGPRDLRSRQKAVAGRLQQLQFVRNRAAHHEPIHRRDLRRDYETTVELVAWIDPDVAAWIAARSTLRLVAAQRPE